MTHLARARLRLTRVMSLVICNVILGVEWRLGLDSIGFILELRTICNKSKSTRRSHSTFNSTSTSKHSTRIHKNTVWQSGRPIAKRTQPTGCLRLASLTDLHFPKVKCCNVLFHDVDDVSTGHHFEPNKIHIEIYTFSNKQRAESLNLLSVLNDGAVAVPAPTHNSQKIRSFRDNEHQNIWWITHWVANRSSRSCSSSYSFLVSSFCFE